MIKRNKYIIKRSPQAAGSKQRCRRIISPLLILLAAVITISCNDSGKAGTAGSAPDSDIVYASRFKLEKTDTYTKLEVIEPWQGATGVKQTYFLVKEEHAVDFHPPDKGITIRVPIKSIVCMSATHVAMIAALKQERTITGISGIKLIYNRAISEAVSKGLITEVGYEESLNREAVLKMRPDLLMAYGVGGESAGYLANLANLGIAVMINAEYLEVDPLGKAEWIKVFGALYCLEERADSLFSVAVEEYESIRRRVSENITSRPKVLLGLPWKDTWYISPGNSFISRLVGDAGGDYLWADKNSDISMPMSLENVFIKAMEATYWLNAGTAKSLNDIVVTDPRLAGLDVFKVGNLYNNNKLLTGTGANDYWERGTTNPGIILKDLGIILHPEIFPGDTLSFYTRLR
jgi:iron complex transport system substrate-binding protein